MDIINEYKLKVAYPTIALTVLAILVYIAISIAAVQGHVNIGLAIFLNSLSAYILFTSMHEAAHLNISGDNPSLHWVNEWIGWLSGITLLAPFYLFRIIHFRHHAYTNDPKKDPDHWLASKNLFTLLYHASTIFPVYLIKGIQLLYGEAKISKKVRKDLKIAYGCFLILILLFVILAQGIGWLTVLQLWVLPALIAQIFLAFSFDWLPHHPHKEKAKFLNTRVIDLPGLNFLLLGQNFHLIHHLYPRIPFYHYKKVFSKLREELIQKGTKIISTK
jgi:fatty acid desaturase